MPRNLRKEECLRFCLFAIQQIGNWLGLGSVLSGTLWMPRYKAWELYFTKDPGRWFLSPYL
jgi:hypothetical protein